MRRAMQTALISRDREVQAVRQVSNHQQSQRSSRHQDREGRLAQHRTCDATENPLAQIGVAIGAHDDEIGAKSCSLRQQKPAHFFSAGRHTSHLHLRAMTCQVARDVRTWFLAMIRRVAFMVDDQDFDRLGLHKQRQGVRHRPDGLAPRVPGHHDSVDPGPCCLEGT